MNSTVPAHLSLLLLAVLYTPTAQAASSDPVIGWVAVQRTADESRPLVPTEAAGVVLPGSPPPWPAGQAASAPLTVPAAYSLTAGAAAASLAQPIPQALPFDEELSLFDTWPQLVAALAGVGFISGLRLRRD